VALSRALCEAAQGRLTMIAGSRDDLPRLSYELARGAAREGCREDAEGRPGLCRFGDVPDGAGADLAEDLAWLLDRVVAAGFEEVLWVDLTHEALGVPVARVVVPGMLGSPSLSDQVRSPRRRAP
jgi:ribosomal protein S12 methylthiotransferase accessory factor